MYPQIQQLSVSGQRRLSDHLYTEYSLASRSNSSCISLVEYLEIVRGLTDSRRPLLLKDVHALDDRGAGVVDAV